MNMQATSQSFLACHKSCRLNFIMRTRNLWTKVYVFKQLRYQAPITETRG